MKLQLLIVLIVALLTSACTGIEPLAMPESDTDGAPTPIDLSEVLPLDAAVRTGALDNGLTYYIRHNVEPENRAQLWLAIDAGSLQEDEDQRGLAHFLEHMLFNGTERFPGAGVVDFLETTGMEFGPDVNAYTSFDETVYTIQVPTDDLQTLNTGFDVLEDWAGAATLDPDAIDQERDVIVEEWRLRYETAAGRIGEQTRPAILGDSRYTDRAPIGDMEVIRNAPPEAFERFYDTWYRPDLMAVIAVGDFDVDGIEAMIQEHFSTLTNPEDAVVRERYEIPATEGTDYLTVTDPEETQTAVQIWHRQPQKLLHTGGDYRDVIVRGLFYSVLNERYGDIAREPDAPFLSARAGSGQYVRPSHVDYAFLQVADGEIEAGLDAALTEVERLRRFGVTADELARAKEETLTFYENALEERDNNDSKRHADEYLRYFFSRTAAPGIELEHKLAAQVLPTITADEVNAVAADLASPDNRVVIVTAPEKDDSPMPGEGALAALVEGIADKEIEAPAEETIATALLEEIPEPVAIIAEHEMPDVGIKEITLENGVRVLMKPTDFMDDEILFTGFSLGGSSLVSDEDYPEAATIVDVITESGVGLFKQSDLEKMLTGKTVAIAPYLRELTEGIEGSSSVDDVETLFQLLYLYITQPRADDDAFEVFKKQRIAALENRELDPNAALSDAVTEAMFGDTIRRGPLLIETIESLDLDRAFEIYQERYADMDDAVFIFVGNIDEQQIKQLSKTYLGNLPATDREESWQNVQPDLPEGIIEAEAFKGEGDRSIVQVIFTGPYEPSTKNDMTLNALETVLDILIREELREQRGGVYSSGAAAYASELPEPNYTAYFYFGAEPDRVDELVDAAFAEIVDLQANGPSDVNLTKAKSIAISQLEESLEQNGYWLSTIKNAELYESEKVEDVFQTAAIIESLTAEDIQAAAQKIFDDGRYIKGVLLPETYEEYLIP